MNILSLGAGYDTLPFWLLEKLQHSGGEELSRRVCYIEVDWDQVVAKKISVMVQHQEIVKLIAVPKDIDQADVLSPHHINAENYKLVAHDVRDTQGLAKVLSDVYKVDTKRPTLVLTECLLVYLKPDDSNNVLSFVRDYFAAAPYLALMNYEMITPHDAFGETMLSNLSERGCDLLGIEACPDLESQILRLQNFLGADCYAQATKMTDVYSKCLNAAERNRIERLEMFDEFEEWLLLQSHYCITFGSRGLGNSSKVNGGEETVTIL